jgi:hypothetical protein
VVVLLGCYGCIFHGTGNSAQLCQNFGISGGGGGWTPQTPLSVRHWYQEYFLGCKGGRCLGLTTLPYTDYLEIWEPQQPGTQRACLGLYRDFRIFTLHISIELKNNILYPSVCMYVLLYLLLYKIIWILVPIVESSMSWDITRSIARQWLRKIGRCKFISW